MYNVILTIVIICMTLSLVFVTIMLGILVIEDIQEYKIEREKRKKEKESNKDLW